MEIQTTTFRRIPKTRMGLVIRTSLVMHREKEFDIRDLYLRRGPHRLWVVLFPFGKVQKGTARTIPGFWRLIAWMWYAEPGCEYVNPMTGEVCD